VLEHLRNGFWRFFSEEIPIIGGHRGWPARYPDNSYRGIAAAARVADFIEIDVRRSRDGVLLLSHDASLSGHRIAGTTRSVLNELSPLLITLEHAFEAAGDTPLNIEIKGHPGEEGFDPELGLQVAKRARPDDLITSFWWPTVDAIARESEVATGLLTQDDPEGALEHARRIGHATVVPEAGAVTPRLVSSAIDLGIGIIAWTVNEPSEIIRLARFGVDGMITDDPGTAKSILRGEMP